MTIHLPRRIQATVWSLVGLFLIALLASASTLIWSVRHNALEDARAQGMRFVAGAEAALNRSFLAVDVLLAGTDDLLGLSNSQPEWLIPSVTNGLLRSSARQNLMVRWLALLDAQGKTLGTSESSGDLHSVNLPVGFLQAALDQPKSSLVVSTPMVAPSSDERVLYFARYVRTANGVKVLAVAQVPVDMLATVLMQGVDIPGLEVTLERRNGEPLLGVPYPERGFQTDTRTSLADIPNPEEKVWNVPARLSGKPSFVVARPTDYNALWISASIPAEAALVELQAERKVIIGVTLLFGLMFFAAGFFTLTYLGRMEQARQAGALSKATLDQALESMVSGFLLLDSQRRVMQWNRRYEEIFPWLVGRMHMQLPFRDVLAESARYVLPNASPMEQQAWVDHRMVLQRGAFGPHEQRMPNGRTIQITERITRDGGLVITYHDVTDLRRASAEIEMLAFYDPLTGLPNRRLLLDRLTQATVAAARSGQFGAVLFLDLDQFKLLNDTLGHEVGDLLLQQVALRLKASVREVDTVARLGGDEFVVMLKDLSDNSQQAANLAQQIGEKIVVNLNKPYMLGTHAHTSASSIGATLFGGNTHNAAELLKQADIAMYQVKAKHGNALCFFDQTMQAAITARAQLDADLSVALTLEQFELHFQPQFTLVGRMVGAEVLLRWRHPDRGFVSPAVFIAAAEERELILSIGQWVLHTACRQLSVWKGNPLYSHLQLAVNVSARQFRHPDFVSQVMEAIEQAQIDPQLLKLELTESLVLDNVDDCIAKMDQLKAHGVQFSVDDFGTGYSSLAYLTRLPLSQLKIDQSFVRNLGVRHADSVIVQTIVGMARNLGLEVIAEGVETVEQKELLAAHGCERYQGYLFARPAPVAALEAMLVPEDKTMPDTINTNASA
jgi:diguanylate cyclase (GGDEF)-like protein